MEGNESIKIQRLADLKKFGELKCSLFSPPEFVHTAKNNENYYTCSNNSSQDVSLFAYFDSHDFVIILSYFNKTR